MGSRPRDPIDQQVREPEIAFNAFTMWLSGKDLGTIAQMVHRHRNSIGNWRTKYRWDARRDAIEAERDAALVANIRAKRRQVVQRHMDLLDATEALCAQALQKLDGKIPDDIPLSSVALTLQRCIVGKRVVLGMPTQTVVNREGPPVDREELSDAAAILRDPELLAEYDRLAARVAAAGGPRPVAADPGGDGGEADGAEVEEGSAP